MENSRRRETENRDWEIPRPEEAGGDSSVEDGAPARRAIAERVIRTGESPGEVLEKLATGDSLGLAETCAQRARERLFLIDVERLFEQSLLRIAQGSPFVGRDTPFDDWVLARVDVAIADLIEKDRRRMLSGDPPWRTEDHGFIEEWMGFDPAEALRAAVRFNDLSERVRRVFFEFLADGKSVARCIEDGLGPSEALRDHSRTAISALLGIDYHGTPFPSGRLGSKE